jgi:photosystem II stability/assembly factor-like uncharacterized protein
LEIRDWKLAIILGLLAGCSLNPTPPVATETESAGAWEVAFQVDAQRPTIAAAFLDDKFGLTADGLGAIYTTRDGGATWVKATDAPGSRVDLDIVDRNLIWHIGVGGYVSVSKDGGQSWRSVSLLPYLIHNEFVSFVDDQTGWAGSWEAKRLWATRDGGQSWSELTLPVMGALVAIMLRTPNDGYLLDDAALLYTTADGGQSWSAQPLGLDIETLKIPPLSSSVVLRFFDADHGLVILSLSGGGQSRVLALRTADGGQSWQQETIPVKAGTFYLTQDGATLTVIDLVNSEQITVLHTTSGNEETLR